ncbi:hypothetical protein [Stackebrandtia nassauensis]|uniref:hypothetical protein n=1 Tax=Stackebrandtia nassauensis TaxID=283811 RepID=UPI001FCB7477|nr:hypothetical protein [Stackebrandtia nassauensis]
MGDVAQETVDQFQFRRGVARTEFVHFRVHAGEELIQLTDAVLARRHDDGPPVAGRGVAIAVDPAAPL